MLFKRDGSDLQTRGLFLDEPAWKAWSFSLTRKGALAGSRLLKKEQEGKRASEN
jgi:hypothetical protein